MLYIKWKEACIYGQQQKKLDFDLQTENKKLIEEVALLNSKLEGMTKSICMMSKNTDVLDEILEVGKSGGDMTGIGFDYRALNRGSKNLSKEHASLAKQSGYRMSNHKSRPLAQHLSPQVRNYQNSTWRCHHCGRFGHIRPYCYKLYGKVASH